MKQNKLFTLFVDGASRGNPGEASIGCVLIDEKTGEEVFAISKAIGIKTNNQAEYAALIEGLTQALDRKITHITIKADSELMVRQMLGEYKVKNPELKNLWTVAQTLFRQLNVSISHVRREENSRADELANLALDSQI